MPPGCSTSLRQSRHGRLCFHGEGFMFVVCDGVQCGALFRATVRHREKRSQNALADYLRLVVQLPSVVYSSASPFSSVLQEAGATHNGVEGAHPPARCSTSTMEPPVFYMRDVWNSDRAVDDRRDTLLWNHLPLAPLSPSPRPRQTNRQATPGQVLLKAPGLESRGSPCPALSNRSTSIPCSWCVVSCRASNTKMARPSGAERS